MRKGVATLPRVSRGLRSSARERYWRSARTTGERKGAKLLKITLHTPISELGTGRLSISNRNTLFLPLSLSLLRGQRRLVIGATCAILYIFNEESARSARIPPFNTLQHLRVCTTLASNKNKWTNESTNQTVPNFLLPYRFLKNLQQINVLNVEKILILSLDTFPSACVCVRACVFPTFFQPFYFPPLSSNCLFSISLLLEKQ